MKEKELRILLKKYIEHVEECEGVNFIDDCNLSFTSNVEFTEEEIEYLLILENER